MQNKRYLLLHCDCCRWNEQLRPGVRRGLTEEEEDRILEWIEREGSLFAKFAKRLGPGQCDPMRLLSYWSPSGTGVYKTSS
jgi:hypothetical protein